ncbi:MAG: hemerythrin domain-containing protein [Brucellaceae bacterium]|nr:hemerythrin domain-containing protein [Brucellaceae bacterium]
MTTASPPRDPADLTRFIEEEYHARHRVQLPALIALSEKVEIAHAGQTRVPTGLTELLRNMASELEALMRKEEYLLFPAIRVSATGLETPIAALRASQHDLTTDISRIHQFTNNLIPPETACQSWTRLYTKISVFLDDLGEHIRLENDVLFLQFETRGNSHV